ncbi:MAG: helix-turn-helix transcriptional regulator [Spirochaetales bacterium]|nr:helix-turn-helix transcriptional regulator [Spirochaetales bacterium]
MEIKKVSLIENKITLLFLTMAVVALLCNLVAGLIIREIPFREWVILPGVTIFLGAIFILISGALLFYRFIRVIQISFLFLTALFAIILDYKSIYGFSLIILANILMYVYGYLERQGGLKSIGIMLFYIITTEIILFYTGKAGTEFELLIFVGFYLTTLFIVSEWEKKKHYDSEQEHCHNILNLNKEKEKLEIIIKTYGTEKLCSILKLYNLSNSEQETIIELLKTGASNKQIAQKRFVSVVTVKKQLSSAYSKMGIESRSALFSLIFNSYIWSCQRESRHCQ